MLVKLGKPKIPRTSARPAANSRPAAMPPVVPSIVFLGEQANKGFSRERPKALPKPKAAASVRNTTIITYSVTTAPSTMAAYDQMALLLRITIKVSREYQTMMSVAFDFASSQANDSIVANSTRVIRSNTPRNTAMM